MGSKPVFAVMLGAEAVSASTGYVLVDLSDTTNFRHDSTGEVHLLGLVLTAEKAGDGVYDLWVGVVTEVDATDGSVSWVQAFHMEAVGNSTDSTDRFAWQVDYTLGGRNPEGLNLCISSGALVYVVTNQTQANNVTWQTDTGLASPAGAGGGTTGRPGAGDLVLWVEEISGTGTIDFHVVALYETA
jgi:hypothetical protein